MFLPWGSNWGSPLVCAPVVTPASAGVAATPLLPGWWDRALPFRPCPPTHTKPRNTCVFSTVRPGGFTCVNPGTCANSVLTPTLALSPHFLCILLRSLGASTHISSCLPAFFPMFNKYLLITNYTPVSELELHGEKDAHLPHRAYSFLSDGNKQSSNYIINEIPVPSQAGFSRPT